MKRPPMLASGILESRYIAASDHTLLVRFGREVLAEANHAALRLMRLPDASPFAGVRDVAPAYALPCSAT